MQAIVPTRPARVRPYAWSSVTVNPNPPRVGEVTRIGFPLANPGPGDVLVERIEVAIARFGMGVPWEQLDPIGPYRLPPDPQRVEDAYVEWTPQRGGHRCVRAFIHVQGMADPLLVGRNLDVIEAGAEETAWRVRFHLGNPEQEPAPIVLRLGADDQLPVGMALQVAGRMVPPGRPVWLRPGEIVEAELDLNAPAGPALAAVRTVEAFIGGRLIDGIQVAVLRPALAERRPRPLHVPDGAAVEPMYALVG